MDDVSGLLAQNFGIRGQGKSAPMAASKTASTHRSVPSSTSPPSYDDFFNPTSSSSSLNNNSNDFFNTSSSSVNNNSNRASFTAHDPILDTFNKGPVFDTPAYDDDDIFNGIPGIRSSSSSSFKYDDMFPSHRSPPPYDDLLGSIGKGNAPEGRQSPPAYDDLLGGFGMGKKMDHGSAEIKSPNVSTGFEDLLPGFGSSTPMSQPKRETEVPKTASPPPPPNAENESFFSGGSFSDPLDNLTKQPSGPVNVDASSPTHSFFSDSMPSFTFGAAATHTERSDPFGGKQSPDSSQHSETGDDIWLTVSEIPLFTKPTSAPPPYRPAPPLAPPEQDDYDGDVDDEMGRRSAAMKDAMNRAELKFKHAKEVREKMAANEREEEEEEERRRRIEREREEEEQRRVIERERQAVERATREARERAANEAMMRAQRGAVHRVQQEARERAAHDSREKAAAAAAEREKEAKERVEREKAAKEKAAAEREKAAKERERKMQRAAVEKAAAEARERAAQAAKEKHQQSQSQRPKVVPPPPPAASAAHQQDDFDSIFGMGGSRSSSVPKKNPQEPQAQTRAPSASPATVRKTTPPPAAAANMMDDLSAIFGGGPSSSSGEFQEIQGETEDRRKARFEREMRTRDRATKALAEKNARDMQVQQEQAERHRIGETLDFEVKRWAAGKEGNLRSLLSSLHYILWAESGWQPVSMADLITGVSVKKVYRKATLCIHPDKVQQKGATLQQKYIAEKVFDILKEAWNKFNSEELF